MIPIIINNFNRLTTTKKLVEDLKHLGYDNIYILDNASTYPPLLEWYSTEPCHVELLGKNLLSNAIYNSGFIKNFKEHEWIVYTDSDIELNNHTPPGFIDTLIHFANKYTVNKVGLSIRIDDLPPTPFANEYRNWEAQHWRTQLEENVYDAPVDTTFCIIKPTLKFNYTALRVAGDLTCRHIPWYTVFDNLPEEELFFLNNSSDYSTYKRYYDTHHNQNNLTFRRRKRRRYV